MKPLMIHSGIYQTLFIAAIVLFAIQQVPALWSTLRLGGRGRGVFRDRGSYTAVQVTVLVGVVLGYEAALHVSSATITWHRPAIFFLGIGVMLLGSVMSGPAIWQLGRYFTVVVAVRPEQPVIQTGLYQIVRHPSYSGQLLVFLGYAITLTNWISIPAVMIPIIAGYLYRIVIEEHELCTELGRPYAEYMTRSYRIIPGVW